MEMKLKSPKKQDKVELKIRIRKWFEFHFKKSETPELPKKKKSLLAAFAKWCGGICGSFTRGFWGF